MVDVHVRHRWPPDLTRPVARRFVLLQPWEYSRVPEAWVRGIAQGVDELWVHSRFVRDAYIHSGVDPARIALIPLGVDEDVSTRARSRSRSRRRGRSIPLRRRHDRAQGVRPAHARLRRGVRQRRRRHARREGLLLRGRGPGAVRELRRDPAAPRSATATARSSRGGSVGSSPVRLLRPPVPRRGVRAPDRGGDGVRPPGDRDGPRADARLLHGRHRLPDPRGRGAAPVRVAARVRDRTTGDVVRARPRRAQAAMRHVFEHREEGREVGGLARAHVHGQLTWERTVDEVVRRLRAAA